ncbi:MAG TPA: M48 family metallopeptidase [Myxococcales bacterium]|jgi:Zn-dependent protease with chaperone function
MALDNRIRSPKERPLFIAGVVFSSIAWLALVVSIIGAVYGAIILAFVLAAHALFLAHVRGNGVRVSQAQLPELHERCKLTARKLGLEEVPEVYLLQAGGALNAFATKLLSRRVVIIYSDLADQCDDPRQLDFVVGHEMGHLAAGHLQWQGFLLPFMMLPWFGSAYSRAREYTCDRAGLEVSDGLEPALRGLAVLAAGGKHAQKVDLAAFMDQRAESGTFWMSVLELSSSHPFLCKRAAALQEFTQPGSVRAVPRNILAYPLAPLFGFAAAGTQAGSMIVVFAMIGMMAAIAIPNFVKFQERAKAAAAAAAQQQSHQRQQPDTSTSSFAR